MSSLCVGTTIQPSRERQNTISNKLIKKNSPDELDRACFFTTWAPLKDPPPDQTIELWHPSILASTKPSLNWFYWVSKILDGLDENNINFWKNLRMSKTPTLSLWKILEKSLKYLEIWGDHEWVISEVDLIDQEWATNRTLLSQEEDVAGTVTLKKNRSWIYVLHERDLFSLSLFP